MKKVTNKIKGFFETFQYHINSDNRELLVASYTDPFMFGGPNGVQTVKLEDFIRALAARKEYFKKVGLESSEIISLEENQLDEHYLMVKTGWKMTYKTQTGALVNDLNSATYLLYEDKDILKIAVQIDHQDLKEKAKQIHE